MGDVINMANAIERGGIVFTLIVALFALFWLYREERKKADKLNIELQAVTKEMITALTNVHNAIDGFKEVLNSVRDYMLDARASQRGKK